MRWPLLGLVLLAACKPDPFRPDAGPLKDAYKPPWFSPAPREFPNWDIQLGGYNFTTMRQMIAVNLWDVVPAPQTLMYADGSMLTVPAGSQASAIAMLHGSGTIVLCHAGTGAMKLTDPDAMKFPGYEATPPNRPTAMKAASAIGWSTSLTDANERFVDFRIAAAADVIYQRIQLAKDIGCDGVLAQRNDAELFTDPSLTPGFTVQEEQESAWIVNLANKAHQLKLSIGGRGNHAAPYVQEVRDDYDWLMAERCSEGPDCDLGKAFTNVHRAVFALDYTTFEDGTANSKTSICDAYKNTEVDGIIKTALDGSAPDRCN